MISHSTKGAKTPLKVIVTGTAGWFCCIFSISVMKFMKGLCLLVFTGGDEGYGIHIFNYSNRRNEGLGKSWVNHPSDILYRIDHDQIILSKLYFISY